MSDQIVIESYGVEKRSSWMFTVFDEVDDGFPDLECYKPHLKKLVWGIEECPTTHRPHAHIVMEWDDDHHMTFNEMVQLCQGHFLKWGKLQYNKKPHNFIKYATKGGKGIYRWDYRTERTPVRTAVGRDARAEVVLMRSEEPNTTMVDLWRLDKTFYFWHRRLIQEYLFDMRAFQRNEGDGHQPNVNF